ncbi:alpha/beta fold hydrolase [Amycolatopsis thermoflava]|uniref:alpha/beta fold hydrolase n=1 Tax=Amycolatopsis thermoflava TaxID=84480 RepID=UPI001E5B0066|nr:alpha/beta fold hydrolase [Amycolatopsis thermoflava]
MAEGILLEAPYLVVQEAAAVEDREAERPLGPGQSGRDPGQKISYWGQSPGTYLGAVYASLFPDRADRVVLEGNVDPRKVWAHATENWDKGMADRFPDAARIAAVQGAVLGLGSTADEVTRNYLELAYRLDRAPAPGTPLAPAGSMLRSVTYNLLLHNGTLPVLAQFWSAAAHLADGAHGDGRPGAAAGVRRAGHAGGARRQPGHHVPGTDVR